MSWYNPVDWWNATIGGTVGQVSSAVEEWVMGAIQSAANLIENDIHDVSNWAEGAAQNLYFGLRQVEHEAVSDFNSAVNWTEGEIERVARDAEGLFWEAEQAAAAGLHGLQDYAVQLWHTAERDAVSAVGTLEHWAQRGFDAVYGWARREIDAAYHAVYHAIEHDFINPIKAVLGPVIKAMDWILWFAEHPFAGIHDLENDVLHWVEHLPTQVANVVRSNQYAEGFDHVAKFLGG